MGENKGFWWGYITAMFAMFMTALMVYLIDGRTREELDCYNEAVQTQDKKINQELKKYE